MKRFITVAVVFALGWLSFGIGSDLSRVNQKVMSRNAIKRKSFYLGSSAQKFDRWYFIVTCDCPCENVRATVWDRSWGNPDLSVATGNLPRLDAEHWCSNCLCESREAASANSCKFSRLDNDSFAIAVTAFTFLPGATLTVEANNIIGLERITVHSRSLGRVYRRTRWNFQATCNGECNEEVTVFLYASYGYTHLFVTSKSLPDLRGGSCNNCFCVSKIRDRFNSCEFNSSSLAENSSSFGISVVATGEAKSVKLSVVGLDIKGLNAL